MKKIILSFVFLFTFSGCQSGPQTAFEKIPVGAEKGEVLHALGNPHRTYRKNDSDRWVYQFSESEKFTEREIWFQKGRVIHKDGVSSPKKQQTGPKDSDFIPIE